MFRLTLRDTSSRVFEAQSLTNSGKASGIVWKFFQTTSAAFQLFVPDFWITPAKSSGFVWKICPQEVPQESLIILGTSLGKILQDSFFGLSTVCTRPQQFTAALHFLTFHSTAENTCCELDKVNIEHISISTKEQSPPANICRSQHKRYNGLVQKIWVFLMYSKKGPTFRGFFYHEKEVRYFVCCTQWMTTFRLSWSRLYHYTLSIWVSWMGWDLFLSYGKHTSVRKKSGFRIWLGHRFIIQVLPVGCGTLLSLFTTHCTEVPTALLLPSAHHGNRGRTTQLKPLKAALHCTALHCTALLHNPHSTVQT